MDILIKLRLYLWLMVLCLWGLMVHQFLEEEGGAPAAPSSWLGALRGLGEPAPEVSASIPPNMIFPPKPPDDLIAEPAPPSSGLSAGLRGPRPIIEPRPSPPPEDIPAPKPPPQDTTSLVGKPSIASRPSAPTRDRPEPSRPEPDDRPKPAEPPTPKGFFKTQTPHFLVFVEGEAPSADFLRTLEGLHANLMLDLVAFSPWARDERVAIYLFRDQDSYRRVTGRPSWSGGASSIKSRKIYLYESPESTGILAHELCHLYFDSFFVGGKPNPLWLSEGMATLVQTERGFAAPNWLRENLALLHRGGGLSLDELTDVDSTAGAGDESVRLWYTQSYSVVRFLIRAQFRSSFYRFCSHLRDGLPLHEALYRAYGMPFNRVKALEYAWRYDLQSSRQIR